MAIEKENFLVDLVDRHRSGDAVGIYSICSAHPQVLRAAMHRARTDDVCLLIEATCNQVNQFGGYTGRTPDQFAQEVRRLAHESGFPADRLLLGGDHLGPSVWQDESAPAAMEKSRELVRSFVAAGFTKIHLDASMSCVGDPVPLPEEIVAERSAELCAAAESVEGCERAYYIVGTEVPVPGGALEELHSLSVTPPEAARCTIETTRSAFRKIGLEEAWQRVIGLVVQPGFEFGNESIVEYDRDRAQQLSRAIEQFPGMVYEAHSTDYQRRKALREMVEDHFCILKVGPALTFAFREAIFALAAIEEELCKAYRTLDPSRLRPVVEEVMLSQPEHWEKHYPSSAERCILERGYSFSDRIRYYWPNPRIQKSLNRLIENLKRVTIPLSILSQYLPGEYKAVRRELISKTPEALIEHKIQTVIDDYRFACGM